MGLSAMAQISHFISPLLIDGSRNRGETISCTLPRRKSKRSTVMVKLSLMTRKRENAYSRYATLAATYQRNECDF